MPQPDRSLVPRVRRDHVGGADLLLHLARRPIRKAGKGFWQRSACSNLDGPQRRFLHRREEEFAQRWTRAGALVSLGGVDDLAERDGAAFPGLLFEQRTD